MSQLQSAVAGAGKQSRLAFRTVTLCILAIAFSFSSVAASPAPGLTPRGLPATLTIPKIGVRASIEHLALRLQTDLHAPYQWGDVAWYNKGPRPGDRGNAVIFGHLDSYCCPAVFWLLRTLRPGDQIRIAYPKGKVLSFRVMWQASYWNTRMPMKWLFGSSSKRGLALITCAGVFHRDGTGYDHKLVVYARLVLRSGHLG